MKVPGAFLFSAVFLSALFLPRAWAADTPSPGDFAGAMVYTGREGSLLRIEIPAEVYRGLMRPDMGDLRIFDASGKSVPFIFRKKPAELYTPPPEEAPFFIWDGGAQNSLPVKTDIEINTSGGVVRIKNQNELAGRDPVFLVDLSGKKYSPASLKITTEKTGQNFNTPVSIHYSGDLSNWQTFDKKQILASFGGTTQDTLELPGTGNKDALRYVLLSYSRDAPRIKSISVSFNSEEKEEAYQEAAVKGQKSRDGKKISYKTEGFYPAESADFVLEEADSIPVLVKNRFGENDEWNIMARGTLYRYNSKGDTVKNPAFVIAPGGFSAAPLWELEAMGELGFNSAPDMVLRWKQKELIFPARGKGPWTLAYGSAACPPPGQTELLPAGKGEESELAAFTGEKRYEAKAAAPKGREYGAILLWLFLGAGVLILGILAYSIARSMRNTKQ